MLTRTTKAIWQVRSVREQIKELSGQPGGPLPLVWQVLDKKANDALGSERADEPEQNAVALDPVNRKVSALYRDVDSADASPTAAQQAALAAVRGEFSRAFEHWNAVIETDIPELNRVLKQANRTEIRLNEKPEAEGTEYDEDLE